MAGLACLLSHQDSGMHGWRDRVEMAGEEREEEEPSQPVSQFPGMGGEGRRRRYVSSLSPF